MDRSSSLATLLGIMAALSLWLIIVNQSQFFSGEFGIYLAKNNTKVVSDSDIQHFNASSHEFTLASECAERLKTMGWRLAGDFTIVVKWGSGVKWSICASDNIHSYPSSQVVIMYPNFEMNYMVMKIQMGYPWDQPVAPDPRDNPRIVEYFERSGRLIQ